MSQLTNQTPFKAQLQTNELLLVENTSFQQRCITETQTYSSTQTHCLFFLVLSQGPISGPPLSAQACVKGPIGSPQGCKRPRGSRRMITLLISPSLTCPCKHTTAVCLQRELLLFFPLWSSHYLGLQKIRTGRSCTLWHANTLSRLLR